MNDEKLTTEMKKIYNFELLYGNKLLRVDEPAGTNCPLAIIFKNKLHFTEISKELSLSSDIEK